MADNKREELYYGTVIVTKGKYKGRIGDYDDDYGPKTGMVYWGDMFLNDCYEIIPHRYLSNNISTRKLAERAADIRNQVARYTFGKMDDFVVRQLLAELLVIQEMIDKRYYNTLFLTPEKEMEVYIAYAEEDVAYARCLATDLQEQGYRVFLKDWSILVGDIKLEKMEEGLSRAVALVPIISKAFLASKECEMEWRSYISMQTEIPREIIPLVMDESEVPMFLAIYKEAKQVALLGNYEHMLDELLMKLKDIEKILQEKKNE